jgi:hypothetical protein
MGEANGSNGAAPRAGARLVRPCQFDRSGSLVRGEMIANYAVSVFSDHRLIADYTNGLRGHLKNVE